MRAQELIDDPVLEDELPEALLILTAQLVKKREAKARSGSNGDRLLSLEDAAEKLRVSTGWLYHKSKSMPFVVRTGRKLSFSERGIEEYIRQKAGKGEL